MAASKIRVELELNSGGYVSRLKVAGQATRSFSQSLSTANRSITNIERSVTSLGSRLRDFVTITGLAGHALSNLRFLIVDWQASVINANAELERMSKLLEGMSTASTAEGRILEAANDLDYLIKKSQEAPFSLNELSNTFVKMRSVGIDPTKGSLDALTNAVAQFGGNDQILHRATIAIQQMAGKGVISMEELRQQLGEAVPSAIQLLARSMNLTFSELVDRISKGQVESQTALQKLMGEFNRNFQGAALDLMGTWTGMTQQMKSQWMLFMKEVGKAGYFDAAKAEFQALINAFADGQFTTLAQEIGKVLATIVKGVGDFVRFLRDNWSVIVNVGKAMAVFFGARMVTGWLAAMRGAMPVLTKFGLDLAVVMMNIRAAPTILAGLTAGLGSLGFALKGLLGPIGIAAGAITGLALLFGFMADEGEDAADRLKNIDLNFVTAEDVILAKQSFNAIKGEYEAVERALQRAREEGNREQGRLGRQSLDLKEKMRQAEFALNRVEAAFQNQAITRTARQMQQELEGAIGEITSKYRTGAGEIDKALREGTVSQEEHKERSLAMAEEMYNSLGGLYQSYSEDLARQLAEAKEKGYDAQVLALETKIKTVEEELRKARDRAGRELDAMRKANVFIESPKGEDERSKKLEDYLLRISNKATDAQAELAGVNGEVAKFIHMLETGQFGNEGKALLGDAEKLKAAVNQIERAEQSYRRAVEARRQITEIEQLAESTQKSNEQALQRVIELRNELATGINATSPVEIRLRGLIEWLDGLNLIAPQAAEQVAKLRAELERGVSLEIDRQALGNAKEYQTRAREIRNSLLSEREQLRARHEYEVGLLSQRLLAVDESSEAQVRMRDELHGLLLAMEERFARDMETPMQALNREWQDVTNEMEQAVVDWANRATDAFMGFVRTGKLEFADLVESMLADLLRLQIQKNVMGPIGTALEGLISGAMGAFGGASSAGGSGIVQSSSLMSTPISLYPNANGGIMTPNGKLPLKTYSMGGIATGPQLALFGEGRMNEAYVPLPDGKSIPVTMSGSGAPNVQVNVINETGQPVSADQQGMRFDGKKMILDVVLAAASRPGSFRDSMRGAMA